MPHIVFTRCPRVPRIKTHKSFSGPFLFDDLASILENPMIRRRWPLTVSLSLPRDFGLTGRLQSSASLADRCGRRLPRRHGLQGGHAYQSEISIWVDAVANRPGDISAHVNPGAALIADLPGEAFAAFAAAARIQPDSVIAQANLACFYLQLGSYDRARETCRAVRLDPGDVNALLVHGQIDAAIEQFQRILLERPDARSVIENLAHARELQRRPGTPP
jgi:tetratricopeptide (TPR) repeat protein